MYCIRAIGGRVIGIRAALVLPMGEIFTRKREKEKAGCP
jgi:hypothetical protein